MRTYSFPDKSVMTFGNWVPRASRQRGLYRDANGVPAIVIQTVEADGTVIFRLESGNGQPPVVVGHGRRGPLSAGGPTPTPAPTVAPGAPAPPPPIYTNLMLGSGQPGSTITNVGERHGAILNGNTGLCCTDKAIFVADTGNARVLRLDYSQNDGDRPDITFVAQVAVNGPALEDPVGVAVLGNTLYVGERKANRIRKVEADGSATVIVETGLEQPGAMVADPAGALYVCEESSGRVMRVEPEGAKWKVSARLTPGQNGCPADARASGVTLKKDGSLFVTDRGGGRLLEIAADGKVAVIAGGTPKLHIDGKLAEARFGRPLGPTLGFDDEPYFLDAGTDMLRRVSGDRVMTLEGAEPFMRSAGGTDHTAFDQTVSLASDPRHTFIVLADRHRLTRFWQLRGK